MSRTNHHKSQRKNKRGLDWGAKYDCDNGYSGGTGKWPKKLAKKERRKWRLQNDE